MWWEDTANYNWRFANQSSSSSVFVFLLWVWLRPSLTRSTNKSETWQTHNGHGGCTIEIDHQNVAEIVVAQSLYTSIRREYIWIALNAKLDGQTECEMPFVAPSGCECLGINIRRDKNQFHFQCENNCSNAGMAVSGCGLVRVVVTDVSATCDMPPAKYQPFSCDCLHFRAISCKWRFLFCFVFCLDLGSLALRPAPAVCVCKLRNAYDTSILFSWCSFYRLSNVKHFAIFQMIADNSSLFIEHSGTCDLFVSVVLPIVRRTSTQHTRDTFCQIQFDLCVCVPIRGIIKIIYYCNFTPNKNRKISADQQQRKHVMYVLKTTHRTIVAESSAIVMAW